MKILLLGEYNRAHRNLKDALTLLNHDVTVVGFTDGFKKVGVDVEIKNHFTSYFLRKIRIILLKTFNVDLLGISVKRQLWKIKDKLSRNDVVQLINEAPFMCSSKSEIEIFKLISSWNNTIYLLSCGPDHVNVSYMYGKKFRYSLLTPYFKNLGDLKSYYYALKYLEPGFIKLHEYIYDEINGVIASDFDYHLPLIGNDKYIGFVPHPINIDILPYYEPNLDGLITIFHGINRNNYYTKGNYIFEEALQLIDPKYQNKYKVLTVENVPYKEYINAIDSCHILLDQVYAYDQGYNALEAMAKGKVVFTGAEQEFLRYYSLEPDTIAINALPNPKDIANKIEWLLENPKNISIISKKARNFVEQNHNHITSAKKQLLLWNKHSKN